MCRCITSLNMNPHTGCSEIQTSNAKKLPSKAVRRRTYVSAEILSIAAPND